jgi:hypothetical protein
VISWVSQNVLSKCNVYRYVEAGGDGKKVSRASVVGSKKQ